MTLTFADAGLLIAAYRAGGTLGQRALDVLNDPDRQFASSVFVRLEVLPKATYYRQQIEVDFYEAFFRRATHWAEPVERVVQAAQQEAIMFGLNAMDALHIAAARLSGVEELVTTERLTTPIHRVTGLRVVTIHPG